MDLVKVEKERAMLRYRRLRRAAALSRWLPQFLAALTLLSWFSGRFPPVLAHYVGLLRRLLPSLLNSLSAFLLGNLIILALVAKSGKYAEDTPPSCPRCPSAYDELHPSSTPSAVPPHQLHQKEEITDQEEKEADVEERAEEEEEEEVLVYEDKGVCLESVTSSATTKKGQLLQWKSEVLPHAVEEDDAEKQFRRSKTEMGARRLVVKRWPGELWLESEQGEEEAEEEEEETKGCRMPAEDDGDEFRRRIEAFIAKQLSFIEREEESLLRQAKAVAASAPPPQTTASDGAS
ncbi:unnamed protein product [Spirodela intermedia]|uniref:Uncharacterized protein n=1 Tax=Spirodela intermedia TaxID=51605 RepID=A0A7I8KWT1_SPIIN|nr:unnamed protein product [Spirodela intermedia]